METGREEGSQRRSTTDSTCPLIDDQLQEFMNIHYNNDIKKT